MGALRNFYSWAAKRHYVAMDPTELLKPRAPSRRPVHALTEEQLARFILAAAWQAPRRAWALLLAYSTGMRRSEACGIRAEDVDLEDQVLHLRHGVKNSKPRDVELGPTALAALEGLRPWCSSPGILGVSGQAFTGWAKTAAEEAGLAAKVVGRPAHILRATFATRLLERGCPISVVSELLGHENIRTTARYLATTAEARREAVSSL